MTDVDGFVLPVSLDKMEEHRKMAENTGKIRMEHGALESMGTICIFEICFLFPP